MDAMKRALLALGLAGLVGVLPAAPATAQSDPEPPFVICENQTYALCATAQCFVYNEVAYCACDIHRGDSISLSLSYDSPIGERNACQVNAEGRFGGYILSTYSYPKNVAEGGPTAIYSCPGIANAGGGVEAPVAYAQCDGGMCFKSTIGGHFPGFPRLAPNEIVCSCPIATKFTIGSSNPNGYQISGPYFPNNPSGQRCDPNACAQCSVADPTANGARLRVGAAAGIPTFLTLRLDGPPVPESNECECTCTKDGQGNTSCAVAEGADN
jgi:hypothetical protein